MGDLGGRRVVSRVALIGDVGGHADDLARVLEALGCDTEHGTMPADLTVLQVGDLVDRGPDSLGALLLALRMWRNHRDRWIQLIGNHETYYLHDEVVAALPARFKPLDAAGVQCLRAVLQSPARMFHRAAVVELADGTELLATHAGISPREWLDLGAPRSARDAAAQIEAATDDVPFLSDGPLLELWATAASVPFGQVFGHCFHPEIEHRVHNGRFIALDRGLGAWLGNRLAPVVVQGAVWVPSVELGRSIA